MKRLLLAIALAGAFAVPLGVPGLKHVSAATPRASGTLSLRTLDNKKCKDDGNKKKKCCGYDEDDCKDLPSRGTVSLGVIGTQIHLVARATPGTAGTQIATGAVVAPHVPRNMKAFKVYATGKFPPLHLAGKGRLLALSVASGRWKAVPAITRTGIYAAPSR